MTQLKILLRLLASGTLQFDGRKENSQTMATTKEPHVPIGRPKKGAGHETDSGETRQDPKMTDGRHPPPGSRDKNIASRLTNRGAEPFPQALLQSYCQQLE
jgi:hypothetical protein